MNSLLYSLAGNTSNCSPTLRGLVQSLILIGLLSLSACSSIVPYSAPFNESDFVRYSVPGTAVIQGHTFVRSDTGIKRGGAGLTITLVPLTAYTEEAARIMASGKTPGPADPRLDKFTRTTVGDVGGGAFEFRDLPAGKYLLYCKIEWNAQYAGTMRRDASGSMFAMAKTEVSNGQTKRVVVTNAVKP
jgi:hypothetical protein